jgi:hypothetical protein
MKHTYAILFLCLFCVSSRADSDLIEQVVEPSVMIQRPDDKEESGYRSIGTGTVIGVKGKPYVLTCAHVVNRWVSYTKVVTPDATTVTIKYAKVPFLSEVNGRQKRHKGEIVLYDKKKDLALLRPGKSDCLNALKVANLAEPGLELNVNEPCYWSGAAYFDWNTQEGKINRLLPRHVAFNGGSYFGHSGSALYVKREKRYVVAGVICGGHSTPKAPSYASPLETVRRFLEDIDD